MGTILLFYKYISIEYPKQILKWQERLCTQLDLKGRIILGHEGINATLGGSQESVERYKAAMEKHPLFGGIDFKENPGSDKYFPRLRIVIKDEIVHLGLDTQKYSASTGGVHLAPEQAHELMDKPPADLVIIDCRNTNETDIGTFTGAVRPNTRYFREFPAYVDQHQDLFKDKTVLMACTGGIRCERASSYVKATSGAKKVYQIEGGIQRYVEKFPNGHFRGKNYVFDARVAMRVNNDVLSSCALCQKPNDDYTNCMNAMCNKQFLCCPECLESCKSICSSTCTQLLREGKVKQRPARINVNDINTSCGI